MGIFSTKIEEEVVAIIDVSSNGVSGAIFLKEKKKVPFLLTYVSKKSRIRDVVDVKRIQKEIIEEIDSICSSLQKETLIKPSKIYCTIASPWAHGEIRHIHVKKEKTFQVTEVYAQKLVLAEIEKTNKEIGQDVQIIDKKIIGASLNGYYVKSPHGQKTTDMTLNVFLSFSHKNLIQEIEDRIHRTFKSKIFFTSQMLVDFLFVRDRFSPKDSLVLNVGQETTEVIVSHGQKLVATAFFPYGKNNLIRNMSLALNRTNSEIESLISLHAGGLLDSSTEKLVEKKLDFVVKMWLSSLKKIMLEILPKRYFPQNIFLVAEENIAKYLYKNFHPTSFPEFTSGGTSFDVIILMPKNLHGFYDKIEHIKPDTNILIKTIYLNQL